MEFTTEQVRPTRAEELLSKLMPNYRYPDLKFVSQMARMMNDGKWLPSSETIKYDEELGLVDGRMRLMAVVESGCTVELNILRGSFEPFHGESE